MSIFNASNINAGVIAQKVQAQLIQLRNAINGVQNMYGWSSGVSAGDLEAIGFSAGDADALLAAISDANAVAQIYETGLPPGSYPQPASAYVYAASQRLVIGPQ